MQYNVDASEVKETQEVIAFLAKALTVLIKKKVPIGTAILKMGSLAGTAMDGIMKVPFEIKDKPLLALTVLAYESSELRAALRSEKKVLDAKEVAAKETKKILKVEEKKGDKKSDIKDKLSELLGSI